MTAVARAARARRPSTVVAERVLADIDAIVERLGRNYQVQVPEYAGLSDAEMRDEVLPVSRTVVEVFFQAVVAGEAPDLEAIPDLRAMGRRRLEMAVPLEAMLHVYRVAGNTVFEAVVAATRPGEESALGEIGAAWMDYIDRASSIAASGYLEASHDRIRRLEARRGAVLQELLSATDASDVAAVGAEFSLNFAPAYVPVLVTASDAAARIDAVARAAPTGSLCGLRGTHLLVLVPDRVGDLSPLSREAGPGLVVWGDPASPGPRLRAEVEAVEAVFVAALARDRRGLFGPDDLVVDRLLAASPQAAAALGRMLEALQRQDRGGLVVSTLRTYLRCGSIPETARLESVHPNTVAYRLRRVAEISGLDPRIPNDAAQLVLAMAAVPGGEVTT
jgi:hypothetical protein